MIPESIADVSSEWLGQVMHAEIAGFEVIQIGQGIGLLGDIFRLVFDGSGTDLPHSVVVKLPSSLPENRAQAEALGMFNAEVRFYNELAPHVTVGLPKIYHAEVSSSGSDFVIVMEDLSHLSMVNQSVGMNQAQAKAAVEVLASIHAVWWDKVQTDALEWIPTMVGPRIQMLDELLPKIFPLFVERFGADLPDRGLALYEQFVGNYGKVNAALCERSPWTLVHQDYRIENLMFGQDGSDQVVVLDWQGLGRGPGVYDLAYVLGGSADPQVRREHEDALLFAYHQRLLQSGVTGYDLDALREDYGHAQLMGGLAIGIVTGTMDISNDRARQLVATMSQRHVTAALDHNGAARLQALIS